MPGLVKIGLTSNPVQTRVSALYTTGVPTAFTIEGIWPVPEKHLYRIEREIHRQLKDFRYNRNREFFVLECDEAVEFVDRFIGSARLGDSDFTAFEGWMLLGVIVAFYLIILSL